MNAFEANCFFSLQKLFVYTNVWIHDLPAQMVPVGPIYKLLMRGSALVGRT